jgi:myo-inositol 2-dehydrogenase/D-chiro-inositol 1-dehydrogenase
LVQAMGANLIEPCLNFFPDRYAAAYRAELDHLVVCVEQGLAPSPGFADGRAALVLVLADAANESLETGRAVRIDSLSGTGAR